MKNYPIFYIKHFTVQHYEKHVQFLKYLHYKDVVIYIQHF